MKVFRCREFWRRVAAPITSRVKTTRLAGVMFYSILPSSFKVVMVKNALTGILISIGRVSIISNRAAIRVMLLLSLAVMVLLAGGCVQRTLTVASNPPGALVYLNDEEIGRTPVTRHFLWYGTYDVELRLSGYESIKTTAPVIAPWWQWVPIDLLAEAFPLEDHRELLFTMHPPSQRENEPELLIRRGEQLGRELESTERPATQPTTAAKQKKPSAKTAKAKT